MDTSDVDDPTLRPAVRRLARREVYRTPWVTVTEDDTELLDGSRSIYSVVHKPDFALIIPVDGDRVHLVEQYRYPVGRRAWEFPQGALSGGRQAPPEEVATTELAEETGLRAETLTVLGYLHAGYGLMAHGYHVVLATGLTQGEPAREREEQDMRSAWFTRDQMWQMIADGRITDAHSLAALALLARYEGEISTSTRPDGPAS